MYKYLVTLFFILITGTGFANHIKGGFFTYKYLGKSADGTSNRYNVKLTVYMGCNPNAGQLNQTINFSVYDGGTNGHIQDVPVSISSQYDLYKTYDEQCITGDQRGCYYTIVIYELAELVLPANGAG